MKFFVAMVLAAVPGLAQAQDPGTRAPQAPSPAKPPEKPIVVQGQVERKVCHTETPTGSIMPQRVCRTESQLADQQADAQRTVEELQKQRDLERHAGRIRAGLRTDPDS